MIRIVRDENVLPPITKLLSAQTFPIKHFESFGISAHMVYDKTDTDVDVFKDVVSELHAKTLDLCEISVSTVNIVHFESIFDKKISSTNHDAAYSSSDPSPFSSVPAGGCDAPVPGSKLSHSPRPW